MTRSRRLPAGTGGFTLVEVMVAMVLAGLVVAVGYAVLERSADGWERSVRRRAVAVGPVQARLALGGWLRSAWLAGGDEPFRGGRDALRSVRSDRLSFAVSDGGVLWPGPHRILLRVPGAGEADVGALVAVLAPLEGAARARPDTVRLAGDLLGLRIRYLVRQGGREVWVDAWSSEDHLPLATEVTVDRVVRTTLGPSGSSSSRGIWDRPLVVPVASEAW